MIVHLNNCQALQETEQRLMPGRAESVCIEMQLCQRSVRKEGTEVDEVLVDTKPLRPNEFLLLRQEHDEIIASQGGFDHEAHELQ